MGAGWSADNAGVESPQVEFKKLENKKGCRWAAFLDDEFLIRQTL